MIERGSWRIATVAGIPLLVHPTFALLLAWLVASRLLSPRGGVLNELLVFVGLFASIVLHELGHALVARRFGIGTRSITLLPIGGLARLERMPERPAQEVAVALAGPVVSLALAGGLLVVQSLVRAPLDLESLDAPAGPIFTKLMWLNAVLAVFNLLPAFPMDGGRVLRGLLSLRLERVRATHLAASVGRLMAVLFGFVGLLFNPLLVLIAVFVWVGARSESTTVELKSILGGVPSGAAMLRRPQTVSPATPLRAVVERSLETQQHDFPVEEDGRIVGLLTRGDLVQGLASSGDSARVVDAMAHTFESVQVAEPLDVAVERLQSGSATALLVLDGPSVVGILTAEQLANAIALAQTLARRELGRPLLHAS